MKNTKRILFTAILTGIMALTACNNKAAETTTTTTTTAAETTTSAPAETTPDDTSAEDTGSDDAMTDDTAADNGADNGDMPTEQTEAQRLAEVVLNSVEFPSMMQVTDSETLSTVMQLDDADFADYGIYMQMISVHLEEIIVVQPAEGKMDAVLEQLNAHKDALINNFAFYPDQLESAQATVVGSKGNYAYLVCDVNAQTAVDALLAEIA